MNTCSQVKYIVVVCPTEDYRKNTVSELWGKNGHLKFAIDPEKNLLIKNARTTNHIPTQQIIHLCFYSLRSVQNKSCSIDNPWKIISLLKGRYNITRLQN